MDTNRRSFLSFLALTPLANFIPKEPERTPKSIVALANETDAARESANWEAVHLAEFPETITAMTRFQDKLIIVAGSSAYIYNRVDGVTKL